MKVIILFFMMLCFGISHSQSPKFTFVLGPEYVLPRHTSNIGFFGNETDGIMNFSLKKDELFINKFDPKTLEQTKTISIALTERTRNFNHEGIYDIGLNYYWLHSDWDKDNEKESLYADKIDLKTGKISILNKKLFSTTKVAGASILIKIIGKYNFNFDADRKYMLVNYRLVPEEKNDRKNFDKIGLQVFDVDMNKVWGSEFRLPYTEAVMDNNDFSIDSKGNAYLLAKVFDSEDRREKDRATGKPAYHYEVFKFSKGKSDFTKTIIEVGDYFIHQTVIIESTTHDMIIASTYSKKAKSNTTDGVFLAMVDTAGNIKKYKNGYYEFPLEEMTKYESARAKRRMERRSDYELPNLVARKIIVNQDGSLFLGFEEFEINITENPPSNVGRRYTYQYRYDNIYGAKINSNGKFDWMRKIPKAQLSYVSMWGSMSYKLIADSSGYYFLYLDHKKNMNLDVDEKPKTHIDMHGGQVVVSKIDLQGNVTKDLLFDVRDEDIIFYPTLFNAINSNQFIGRAEMKGGGFKPLLITRKE